MVRVRGGSFFSSFGRRLLLRLLALRDLRCMNKGVDKESSGSARA